MYRYPIFLRKVILIAFSWSLNQKSDCSSHFHFIFINHISSATLTNYVIFWIDKNSNRNIPKTNWYTLSSDPEKLEKVLQKMTDLLEKHKNLENRMKDIEDTILQQDSKEKEDPK